MIEDAKGIIEQLNSPSDWSLVGGAAVLGLVLDGAINIVPLPFFSPGVCAVTAAGIVLSAKRGVEAISARKSLEKRHVALSREAQRCIRELNTRGEEVVVDELNWRLQLDGDDTESLEDIVRDARESLRDSATSAGIGRSLGIPLSSSLSEPEAYDILRDGMFDLRSGL